MDGGDCKTGGKDRALNPARNLRTKHQVCQRWRTGVFLNCLTFFYLFKTGDLSGQFKTGKKQQQQECIFLHLQLIYFNFNSLTKSGCIFIFVYDFSDIENRSRFIQFVINHLFFSVNFCCFTDGPVSVF